MQDIVPYRQIQTWDQIGDRQRYHCHPASFAQHINHPGLPEYYVGGERVDVDFLEVLRYIGRCFGAVLNIYQTNTSTLLNLSRRRIRLLIFNMLEIFKAATEKIMEENPFLYRRYLYWRMVLSGFRISRERANYAIREDELRELERMAVDPPRRDGNFTF